MVMKATELMVGDWVYCEGQPTPDNVTIETITEDGVWFNGPNYEGAASYDRIFPIPITPEILEKNGFENISDHTLKGCDTFRLDVEQRGFEYCVTIKLKDYFKLQSYDDRWYTLCEMEFGCHNVHELQHALRLCGIDKEIVL